MRKKLLLGYWNVNVSLRYIFDKKANYLGFNRFLKINCRNWCKNWFDYFWTCTQVLIVEGGFLDASLNYTSKWLFLWPVICVPCKSVGFFNEMVSRGLWEQGSIRKLMLALSINYCRSRLWSLDRVLQLWRWSFRHFGWGSHYSDLMTVTPVRL